MTLAAEAAAPAVELHCVYETAFVSIHAYPNPSADVETTAAFTAPSGKTVRVPAFWDGDDVWRVRFSPCEIGKWTWRSSCSDKSNSGLDGRQGSFECVPYRGGNKLLQRGPLRLSENRRYFVHADGTPFFWLADTAWNGVLKARPEDWNTYLKTRRSQGFTAVQSVATQWRAYQDEAAYTGRNDIRINPGFFKRLDPMVKAINDHGLVAAPVMLWAVTGNDPGHELSEQDAIRLARYMAARWGAWNVFWILAGDGEYLGRKSERWLRIGRAVFGDNPGRPATLHPTGRQWIAEEFGNEPWYSMIGYQSTHSEQTVPWLVQGPPAKDWDRTPALPVVNLEPNYEGILSSQTKKPFDALAVRRALYRSLLVSPTAGVTYGHHGVWSWAEKPEVPLNHPNSGVALPWRQALQSEGSKSVKRLAGLFASVKWWTLAPDPALVANQPDDPFSFVPAARDGGGTLALIYLPQEAEISLNTEKLRIGAGIRWFNPSTGRYFPAGRVQSSGMTLQPPGSGDWVLVVGGMN